MRIRFDIPAIQVAANGLLQQCERLVTVVEEGDTEALLGERMRACHEIANQLYRLLMASDSPMPAFDYQNILDAKLPADVRTGLISLRERLDRIFHPSNFRGVRGDFVDPLKAESAAFNRPNFRDWAAMLRPAVAELNAVSIDNAVDLPAGPAVKLSPTKARALEAYQSARKANPGATMRELYDWLEAEGDDSYTPPGFESWERYVREGRRVAKRMESDSR